MRATPPMEQPIIMERVEDVEDDECESLRVVGMAVTI